MPRSLLFHQPAQPESESASCTGGDWPGQGSRNWVGLEQAGLELREEQEPRGGLGEGYRAGSSPLTQALAHAVPFPREHFPPPFGLTALHSSGLFSSCLPGTSITYLMEWLSADVTGPASWLSAEGKHCIFDLCIPAPRAMPGMLEFHYINVGWLAG